MDQFERSEWKKEQSAREFIENADMFVLERKRLLEIVKSLYKYFLMKNPGEKPVKVLDLGCGDGRITQELLKVDQTLEGTLMDGSREMLEQARKRLKSFPRLNYLEVTFQELMDHDAVTADFDFIVSSLAIHHLPKDEKEKLFEYIHHHLISGGFFLNVDVVRAPSEELEDWYLTLWREWIMENELKTASKESFTYMPNQYKNNPDNHPDTLEEQLNTLSSIGFQNVDCYYKYGIFCIYGGQKSFTEMKSI